VFAQVAVPGFAYFAGPTAGYLLSYPVAAFVTGWLVERRPSSQRVAATLRLLGALLAGELVIFSLGCVRLAAVSQKGLFWALGAGAAPFLPGELLKLALIFAAIRGVEIASRKN
jgi:biotin transport system substrate-specific component